MEKAAKMRRKRAHPGALLKDRRGASLVEFGILALPFFLLVFAVLETTISFTAEQVMANTVDKMARKIRTGQINSTMTDEAAFRELICNEIGVFVANGCPDLHVDLQSYATYEDVPKQVPFSSPGVLDTSGFDYDPGGPRSINQLRILYEWPVYTNMMQSRLAGLENGRMLLFSTTTWQNEP